MSIIAASHMHTDRILETTHSGIHVPRSDFLTFTSEINDEQEKVRFKLNHHPPNPKTHPDIFLKRSKKQTEQRTGVRNERELVSC